MFKYDLWIEEKETLRVFVASVQADNIFMSVRKFRTLFLSQLQDFEDRQLLDNITQDTTGMYDRFFNGI
jgi:hypothetical protein